MKDLKRKAVSTLLAGSLLFGSGALTTKVDAYSLNKVTMTYEELNKYNGVKIFINGRLVEFNDSLGYPYISSEGRTMIPLRAVAETFGAHVDFEPNTKMAIVSKHGTLAEVKIDYNKIRINEKDVITTDTNAVIKNGRTYIPLRALFENFGLNVRWDQNTKTAHIESDFSSFKNIDFKDEKVTNINDLDVKSVNKIIFDGVEINKNYVNILKNSNQYKVLIKDGIANIYSYAYLNDLNYIYGKEKESYQYLLNRNESTILKYVSDKEFELYHNICLGIYCDLGFNSTRGEDIYGISYKTLRANDKSKDDQARIVARQIANDARKVSSNPYEQVEYIKKTLYNTVEYDEKYLTTAYDALVIKKSACNGIMSAVKMIMEELEIPCLDVYGTLQGEGHGWNVVKIGNEWKIVDATNDFPLTDKYSLLIQDKEDIDDYELIKLTYKF